MHMAFLSRGFKNLQWYSMTEDLYILDILSATLRVSGGLGLLFFQVLQFFESYFWQFLLSEWIRTYD